MSTHFLLPPHFLPQRTRRTKEPNPPLFFMFLENTEETLTTPLIFCHRDTEVTEKNYLVCFNPHPSPPCFCHRDTPVRSFPPYGASLTPFTTFTCRLTCSSSKDDNIEQRISYKTDSSVNSATGFICDKQTRNRSGTMI